MNVTRADRNRLEAIVSDRSEPQKHVWRANIILATATAEIMRRSGKSKPVVWRWQAQFKLAAEYCRPPLSVRASSTLSRKLPKPTTP